MSARGSITSEVMEDQPHDQRGRLPAALAAIVDLSEFKSPSARDEQLIAAFEARWPCHVATYRANRRDASQRAQLCKLAYAADIGAQALDELHTLERRMDDLTLVAYARPWRFRARE